MNNSQYTKGRGWFTFSSRISGVKVEKVCCAVEWRDGDGIIHRFESSGLCETSVQEDGEMIKVIFEKNECPKMVWTIVQEENSFVLQISVTNTTGRDIKLRTMEPMRIMFNQGGDICLGGQLNQAYLYGEEKGVTSTPIPLYLWAELYHQDKFSAEGMLCFYQRDTMKALTLGFLTTKDMFGRFTFEWDNSFMKPEVLVAFCDAEEINLPSGETALSEKLWINFVEPAPQSIEKYAARTGKEMQALHSLPVPTGWSTWDYYFGNISEEIILANVKFLRDHYSEAPVEYIQIDAGYSVADRNWRVWNNRFPHGPQWLVEQIRKLGFKAGIWLIPFYVSKNNQIAKDHPGWLVKDEEGEPVTALEDCYVLDGSHPEVQKWLEELGHTITQEWNFDYIKMDGASLIGMVKGVHYDPSITGCKAYRLGIMAFRRGLKEGTFLMGGVFWPSIGLVDGMRIGPDVGARWDWRGLDVHHGQRDRYHGSGNVYRAIVATLNRYYMHKNFWINDGDYLVVRDDRSELTFDEARTWASVLGLYGGSMILGDNMTTLAKERFQLISKVLPLCGISAKPVDFLTSDVPSVMAADIQKDFETWKVVALINYDDCLLEKVIDLKTLGLDSNNKYHVFGFWEQHYYEVSGDKTSIPLPAHGCEVLAIRKKTEIPQLIGTDIHITQGAVEVSSICWSSSKVLEIGMQSPGRKCGCITLFIPDGWKIKHVGSEIGELKKTEIGNLLRIFVEYNKRSVLHLEFE